MKKRLISLSLVAALLFTFFNFPISAREVIEPLETSFSLSKEAVKPGETVKVSFSLDNYDNTAVSGIKAFDGHLKADKNLGVIKNFQSSMLMNEGENLETNIADDGTVHLFYESSWSQPNALNSDTTETSEGSSYYILPRDNKVLFTFDLAVNKEFTADQLKKVLFETMEFTFADAQGEEIRTEYELPTLDVLTEEPQIFLNGDPVKETAYTEMVEVTSDKGTVVLKDKDQNIIEDNVAKVDGEYTVVATDAAGNQSTAQFIVKLGVKSLSVSQKPKTQYYVGESLDLKGGMLRVTYANEEITKEIPMTEESVKVAGYDPKQVGTQEITLSYTENGKTVSTTMEVEVLKNGVESITWNTQPEKVVYIEGQELDLKGGSINVVYKNGDQEAVELSSGMISGYNKDKIGEQIVTVTYGEKTLTFVVTVKEKSVTGIEAVLDNPRQKIGTQFDEKGTVTVFYDNGTEETVSFGDKNVTLTYPDNMMDSLGEKEITVSYLGKETTVSLTVIDKVLTGIEVKAPSKTHYIEGQKLDVAGGKVVLIYDNDTREEIPLEERFCSETKLSQVGTQTITVTYSEFTAVFDVTVEAKSIVAVEWDEKPTKTEFMEKEEFSVDGKIKISYNNGTSVVDDVTEDMVSGFHSEQPGKQELTVTYPGCEKALTYEVTVLEKQLESLRVTKLPDQKEYLQQENGSLDLAGMEVYGHYNNGYDYLIDNSQLTVSGYDLSRPGVQNITVSYQGINARQVVAITVVSRESVDALDQKIDEMDADALTVKDEQAVLELLASYDKLSQIEQQGLNNYQQLKALEAQMNKLVKPQREESFENTGWKAEIPSGTIRYDVSFTASEVEVTKEILSEIRQKFGDLSEVLSAMQFTVDGTARSMQYLPSPVSLRYDLKNTDQADRVKVVGQAADGTLSEITSRIEQNALIFTADEKYEAYYVVSADAAVPPANHGDDTQQGMNQSTPNPGVQNGGGHSTPDTSDSFFGLAAMLLAVSGVLVLVLIRRKYDA